MGENVGETLALGSWDDTVILWDARSGDKLVTLEDTGSVSSLTFSSDGEILASGSIGGDIIIWDVEAIISDSFIQH